MLMDMQGHSQYVKASIILYRRWKKLSGATVDEMRSVTNWIESVQSQQPQTPNIQPQTPKVDLPETYTVAGVTYNLATGLPVSGTETQGEVPGTPLPRGENQNQGESVSPSSSSSTPTPGSMKPSTQSSGSNISNISTTSHMRKLVVLQSLWLLVLIKVVV